jgi:hypothetical protein
MHPDPGTLAAYRDRELSEPEARDVARHLETCPRCAREAETASAEWALSLAADAQFRSQCVPPADGLEQVLGLIQEWRRSAAAEGVEGQASSPAELRRRIGAQLELYFGSETGPLLESIACSRRPADNLITAVEPLLTAFLGRKAAGVLMRRILEGSDQRLCLSPETA